MRRRHFPRIRPSHRYRFKVHYHDLASFEQKRKTKGTIFSHGNIRDRAASTLIAEDEGRTRLFRRAVLEQLECNLYNTKIRKSDHIIEIVLKFD